MPTCLDTDIIVEFFRGNKEVSERLKNFLQGGDFLFVTRITLCELFRGAYLSQHPEREAGRIRQLMGFCRVLGFPFDACIKFGKISAQLSKEGRIINDADLLIGSIALSHGCTLVTNNTKHFERIPGLKLENWCKK